MDIVQPVGPGRPFELFFSDGADGGLSLPESFRRIYPGDWRMPAVNERPYIYTNFAQSRDGRISFNIPGAVGGGFIPQFDPHDRWLMGLLRARADAVLIGDVTVNLEPESIWTAEAICPPDAAAFASLRQAEGYRRPAPLLVILSYSGRVAAEAACFQREDLQIVLATTAEGAVAARELQLDKVAASVEIQTLGVQAVDLVRLVRLLQRDYGVRYLLCEGGARVFANLLAVRLVDEEFLTICPTFVGRSDIHFRPSYCEGVAWRPDNAPYSKPISLHRAGDLLFMRTRCEYKS